MNMVIFIKKDHFLMWIIFEIFKCRNSSYLNPNSEILSHWLVERFLFRWSLFNFKELIIYLTCLIFNFFFFLKIMILTHIGKSRKLFPKNGRWLRGYPGNFFQTFSRFCNFGAWLRGFSGNYFQVNFMSTYPWKNIFSQKRVMTQRLFRKLFPISGKSFRKFSWVITRIYEISNFI